MATLLTYRELVQNEVDDTSARAQVVIDQNIKDVYQEILRQTAKYLSGTSNESITTSSGTSTYTPTNDYTEILAVHNYNNGNWDLLDQITRDEYLQYHINDDSSTPTRWYENGGNIELSPAPSAAGTIRVEGVVAPTDLSGGTVTSVIPDRFTNVVLLGSVARFLGYEKDPLFKDYKALYEMALRDMVLELSTKTKTLRPSLFKKQVTGILR